MRPQITKIIGALRASPSEKTWRSIKLFLFTISGVVLIATAIIMLQRQVFPASRSQDIAVVRSGIGWAIEATIIFCLGGYLLIGPFEVIMGLVVKAALWGCRKGKQRREHKT